jgi:hypothetical protein
MRNRPRSLPSGFVLILAILLGSSVVRADVTESIPGVVRDRSQGAKADAQLTITDVETNLRYQATTGPDGSYGILALPAGDYKLSVTASGFRTFVETDIVVKGNDQLQETQAVSNAAAY